MLENDIIFTLGWPPTVNSYYSCTKHGLHMSKKGRLYADDSAVMMREQNVPRVGGIGVSLAIVMYPPDKRKRDLDNHMKALQDAITKHEVWDDDSQIHQLYVFRGRIIKGGKAIVRIANEGMIIPESMEQIAFNMV
jgi:crossover junction endodeoxyribonuclease RusA